jgi:hypothetical protein
MGDNSNVVARSRGENNLQRLATPYERAAEFTVCKRNLAKYVQKAACKTGAVCWLFMAPTSQSIDSEDTSMDDVTWAKSCVIFTHGVDEWESLRSIARNFNPMLGGSHAVEYSRNVAAAHSLSDEEARDRKSFFSDLGDLLRQYSVCSSESTWNDLSARIQRGVLPAKGAMVVIKEGIRAVVGRLARLGDDLSDLQDGLSLDRRLLEVSVEKSGTCAERLGVVADLLESLKSTPGSDDGALADIARKLRDVVSTGEASSLCRYAVASPSLLSWVIMANATSDPPPPPEAANPSPAPAPSQEVAEAAPAAAAPAAAAPAAALVGPPVRRRKVMTDLDERAVVWLSGLINGRCLALRKTPSGNVLLSSKEFREDYKTFLLRWLKGEGISFWADDTEGRKKHSDCLTFVQEASADLLFEGTRRKEKTSILEAVERRVAAEDAAAAAAAAADAAAAATAPPAAANPPAVLPPAAPLDAPLDAPAPPASAPAPAWTSTVSDLSEDYGPPAAPAWSEAVTQMEVAGVDDRADNNDGGGGGVDTTSPPAENKKKKQKKKQTTPKTMTVFSRAKKKKKSSKSPPCNNKPKRKRRRGAAAAPATAAADDDDDDDSDDETPNIAPGKEN